MFRPSFEARVRRSSIINVPQPNQSKIPQTLSSKIKNLEVEDEYKQNELHHLCGAEVLNLGLIQKVIESRPDFARRQDVEGLLPLHVLGYNSELLTSQEGMLDAKAAAYMLMETNEFPMEA